MSTRLPKVPEDIAAAGWTLVTDVDAPGLDPESQEETTGLLSVEMTREVDGHTDVHVGSGATYEEAMRNATGIHG